MVKKWSRILLVFFIILLDIGLDQVTKKMAKAGLEGRGTRYVVGDVFVLHYIENEGAFLGMGSGFPAPVRTLVFVAFPLLVLAGLLVFLLKSGDVGPGMLWGLAFITGGGISNLIDRLLYHGRVSDFMNLGIGDFRTGIFNVADLSIVAGLSLILVFELMRKKKTGGSSS